MSIDHDMLCNSKENELAVGRWKRYALVAGWGAVAGAIIIGMGFILTHNIAGSSDFAIYLAASNALRHNPHATIYSLSTLAATHATYGGCAPPSGWGYLYQPLLALALQPLLLLPCGDAATVWLLLNMGLWLACIVWLARWMGQRYGAGAALATAALCALTIPVYEGFYYGQAHILILGVCLGAVSLMRRRRPRWAGALLALGAFLKYLPALLLVYYLTRREWGAAIGAAITTAALGLLELIIVGPTTLWASVFGGSSDLLANIPRPEGNPLSYAPYAMSFIALAIYGVVTLALARKPISDSGAALGLSLGEAWAIGAMAVVSPQMWYHYFTWLLPVAIALLGVALGVRNGAARWASLAGLTTLCALTFINTPEPPPMLLGLLLWLTSTGVLLAQISNPLAVAQRSPEQVAAQVSSR